MLRLRKIKSVIILAVVFAFAASCSNDEEVIEQQEPQTQISESLRQSILSNSQANEASEAFRSTINWYAELSTPDSYCDLEIAVLAYEIFDADNNSLNEINIVPWIAGEGFTFEDITNELELIAIQQYGEGVQIIFVAGLFIKNIDEDSYEIAEINNFATFSDFFDDCQSDDVTFEEVQGTFAFDFPIPDSDDVDFPDTPAPCTTLDFPLDIIVADAANFTITFEETVDELQFLDYLQGNVTGFVFVDFVYPLSLTLNDDTQIFANNAEELSAIFNNDCE